MARTKGKGRNARRFMSMGEGDGVGDLQRLRRAVFAANRRADEAEAREKALRATLAEHGITPDPF